MVARGKGEGRMGSDCLMCLGFPFGVMEMFWNSTEVVAADTGNSLPLN